MMEFQGLNGRIIFDEKHIRILRENSIDSVFHKKREKKILYADIKEIVFVPGSIINGYICCVEKEKKAPTGIASAMRDENTIIFRMFKNKEAKKIVQNHLNKIK